MRIRSLCVMLLAGLVVAGCDSDCPTPTGPTSPNPGLSVASLTIGGPNELQVGQSAQLTATAHFSDGSAQDVTTAATWVTNNVKVCTINADGVLTSVSSGQCTVTAVFQNTTATKVITCYREGETPAPPSENPPTDNPGNPGDPGNPPPTCTTNCGPGKTLTSLLIQGVTTARIGQTSQLQLIASYNDGSRENVTSQGNWTSGNPGVATVGNGGDKGLVTGVAVGSAPITATIGTQSATVTFTVSDNGGPTTPTVNGLGVTGTTPLMVGQTAQYNAVASLSDGTTPNVNGQSQWTSSNPGVATVSGTGVVTAVAAGTTTITATYQGHSGAVALTVNANGGPAQPDLIGLEVRVGADVLTGNGPLGLNLNLADLLNGNPILDLKVFGLYSDGSKKDVTSVAAITSPSGLIDIDRKGTVEVLALLLQGLLNPNHQINVTYGGFTANVVVQLQLPVLQSLGFPSNTISVVNGNKLPSLNALFSQGINSTVDASLPGIQYALTAGGPVAGVLNTVLGLLGVNLNQVLSITNGVVNVDSGLLGQILGNPLIQAIVGSNGLLPLDLTATLNGVTTAPIRLNVGR